MHSFSSLMQRIGMFLRGSDSAGQIVRIFEGRMHIRMICNTSTRPLKLECALDGVTFCSDRISQHQKCADGALELNVPLPIISADVSNITVRTGRFYRQHLAGSPWYLNQKSRSVNYALLHIPKTAGTSLRVALEGALGGNKVFPNARYLRLRGGKYLNYNEMADALTGASSDVSLIQGHLPLASLRELAPDAKLITVLRKPVERVTSLLKHMKIHHRVSGSFEEMLRESGPAGTVSPNQQTRLLSLLESGAPMEEHVESAKEQLATFAVVGLAERYRETLSLCEGLLGLSLGKPRYLNLSKLPGDHWSTEMTEEIEELNRFDAELYRYAEQIFARQLQGISVDI